MEARLEINRNQLRVIERALEDSYRLRMTDTAYLAEVLAGDKYSDDGEEKHS